MEDETRRRGATEVEAAGRDPANVFGKYVRLREIGHGGFGSVWLAWDRELSRHVAMKFLHGYAPEDLVRFQREARTAGKLSHPGIVQVHAVGEERGAPFIVMEYVEGRPADEEALAPRQAVDLIRQAAEAVDYAHRNGVVHRDLKPANLMVVPGDPPRARVMDFGLAKSLTGEQSLSLTGEIMGTPNYMSPEQARGDIRAVGPRSDVWSLGATLYMLVAGRTPFEGESAYEIVRNVIEKEPRPPTGRDADLDTIILKCLEKDPSRRYESAAALAEDLRRVSAGEPILAHPPSMFYRWRKGVARRKAATGAVALMVALAAVIPLWMLALSGESEAKRVLELWSQVSPRLSAADGNFRAGDLKRAEAELEAGIAACRESLRAGATAEAHYFLGRLLHLSRRNAEAQAALEEALRLNPELGEAHLELGLVLVEMYAARVQQHRAVLLEGRYSQMLFTIPEKEVLEVRDPEMERLSAAAREHLSVRVGSSPYFRSVDATFGAADLTRLTGDIAGAERLYRSVLAEDPLFTRASTVMMEFALHHGDVDRAIEIGESAVERNRGEMLLQYTLISAYERRYHLYERPQDGVRDLERALEHAERLVALGTAGFWGNHQRARVRFQLAQLRSNRGEDVLELYQQCERDYAGYVEALSREPSTYVSRSNLYRKMASAVRLRGMDPAAAFESAVRDAEAAVNLDPQLAAAYQVRCWARAAWADYRIDRGEDAAELIREAIADGERAVELSDALVEVRHVLAQVYRKQAGALIRVGGDPLEALRAARRHIDAGIALEPEAYRGYLERIEVTLCRAEAERAGGANPEPVLQEALRDCDELMRAGTAGADRHGARGLAYWKIAKWLIQHNKGADGLMRKALADYTSAAAMDPENPIHPENQGWIQIMLGEYEAAARDFGRSVVLDPSRTDRLKPHIEECTRKAASGDSLAKCRAAVEYHQKISADKPDDAEGFFNLGVAWWKFGGAQKTEGLSPNDSWKQGIAAYDRAIALDERLVIAYRNRGFLRLWVGRTAEARADFVRAIELDQTQKTDLQREIERCDQLLGDF